MNIARIRRDGEVFEVVIDVEKAMAFKKGKVGIEEAVVYPKIFSDAKKGDLASDSLMQKFFKTSDSLEVAKIIINEGEVQLTAEYRKNLIESKKRRIIELIHRQGIDPRTNAPHTLSRVESALEEARVRIDAFKPAEEQVQTFIKSLRPILPIKIVVKKIKVKISPKQAGSVYKIKSFGGVIKENWGEDGSWECLFEIPGGLETEFYDKVNNYTKGEAEITVVEK